MTAEQRIRGTDGTIDAALIVTAHDEAALKRAREQIVGTSGLGQRGATRVCSSVYALHYALSRAEINAR